MHAPLGLAVNPLLPAGYDILWTLIIAAVAALLFASAWQILRSPQLTGFQSLVWLAVVLALPVLGPFAWFVLRPKPAKADARG